MSGRKNFSDYIWILQAVSLISSAVTAMLVSLSLQQDSI